MKEINEIYLHEGNGHNFSIAFFNNNKCRMKRYHTNGADNRNYQLSEIVEIAEMSRLMGIDLLELNGKYFPSLKEIAAGVWHNDLCHE